MSSNGKIQSSTGMLLDGVFGSEAIDSSGEILDVEGADISDLEEGKGVFNWEHRGEDAHGASPNDIVGKILYAKKIFKRSDCETERERAYWDEVKMPFIYGVGRLYDAAGHPGAIALAAQIRDHHANNEPILVRFSVEGSTLEKKNNRLLRSVIRRVALTLKPCNKTAHSGLLSDPNAPDGFDKAPEKKTVKDLLEIETQKFEHPNFSKLGSAFEVQYSPLDANALAKNKQELATLVKSLAKLKALQKIHTIVNTPELPFYLEYEDLEKGEKLPHYLKFMGNHPKAQETAEWAEGNLNHRGLAEFAMRHAKTKPEGLSNEEKTTIKHFGDSLHMPEVQNAAGQLNNKHNFETGIQLLQNAQDEYSKRHAASAPKLTPVEGKKLLDLGDGVAVYNLPLNEERKNENEATAMSNCGTPHEGGELWSIRKDHGNGMVEPMVTIAHEGGYIGEVKGKYNWKPHTRYHPYIAKLMASDLVKGFVNGGYAPESNFEFSDMKDGLRRKLLEYKPALTAKVYKELLPEGFQGNYNHVPEVKSIFSSNDVKAQIEFLKRYGVAEKAHRNAARNPNISPETLHHLVTVNQPGSDVHENAARNPNISQELLHHLFTVNEPGSWVHRYAAGNPNISQELLHHLVTTNEPGFDVHRSAALNPNISQELLHHLVTTNEPGSWVHENAARNPNISQELLHHLVTTNEPGSNVHRSAASNPNISQELLHHLVTTNKPGSYVHQDAASNPNISQELLHHLVTTNKPGSYVHQDAARNPNISPELLHHLVTTNEPGSSVYRNAAENPQFSKLPLETQKKIRPLIGENIQKIISMINDENNPEQARIAQQELVARRKARYDKILSPEGNLEELQHLAESHNEDISKRARAELKRRGSSKSEDDELGKSLSNTPLYLEYEDLEKGEKLPHYLKFMGNHPKAQETAEWAEGNLNHRGLAEFAMRHAKTKPEGLSNEEKAQIKHFGDSLHMPEVQNAAGQLNNKHNFETGIQLLQNAQDEYSKRHAASAPKLTPVEGKKLLDLGDGVAVYNLPLNEERKNENEATAMSNCGTPHEGGELWSIRKDHGNGMVEPMVTIAHEGGYIGEVKGKYNWKPHTRYHPYIAKLMASDLVKGFVNGGYAPESNFEFSDMNDGLRKKLLEYKRALTAKVYKELLPEGFQGGYNHVPEVKSIFSSNDVKAQIEFLKKHKPGSWVHESAAKNPNISQEALHHLVTTNKPRSDVHENAASNPNISPELLHHLVTTNKPGSHVHSSAAKNPNISQELLHHLVTTNEPGSKVHENAAKNPNISPELLHHLVTVNQPDSYVNWMAVSNPNISQESLHHLVTVNEPGSVVHWNAARNPNISQELLHHLVTTNQPGSHVHRYAASNPNISQELLHHLVTTNKPGSDVHWNAARNPNISQETLHHLVTTNKPGSNVHQDAASNPNISQETLHHLITINKPGSDVHWNAARNPNISPELLHHLVTTNKPGSDVHRNAAENPQFSKLPLETQKMVRQTFRPLIGENIQKIISMINDRENPEQAKIAQQELVARRKAKYDKALSPEGNLEELQHLAESHDEDISKRARAELKRRGLSKSIKNLDTLKKINKAIAAGTGAGVAAPSALASDEALKKMKNGFMSAFRDFKKPFQKAEFKQFLKHYLPECDDEYLDRFTDLAEDVKLKKSEKPKKPKAPASIKVNDTRRFDMQGNSLAAEPEEEEPTEQEKKASKPEYLTVRGQKVPLPSTPQELSFDKQEGILHTPLGSLSMYDPIKPHELHRSPKNDDAQSLDALLNNPRVEELHNGVMRNWIPVNQMNRRGEVHPQISMYSNLFSILSPRTAVALQEHKFAHLYDSMRLLGIDAKSRDFADVVIPDWLRRDHPTEYPELARDYFRNLGTDLHLKADSPIKINKKTGKKTGSGRFKGEIKPYGFTKQPKESMSRYHEAHDGWVDLTKRHRASSISAIRELMLHKPKAESHEKKRREIIESEGRDIGPYADGPYVHGLAPKTGLYSYGMQGGEDAFVFDTHCYRYSFGLEDNVDGPTLNYVKSLLDEPKNFHIIEGMQDWLDNHPAVQHMLQHPIWGKYFDGNPKAAKFVAFWKLWNVMTRHEKARGYRTGQAHNLNTDHTPFWEAVGPFLNKSETPDALSLLNAVRTHIQWIHQYGEIPALMMYYQYIVPQLLATSNKKEGHKNLTKSQALSIELKKAVAEVGKPENKWLVSHMSHAIAGLANEPEQQDLVEGLDLTDVDPEEPASWIQLKNGQHGYVKSDWSYSEFNRAKKEAAFYNVAKNVFGLSDYVPVASAVKNPNGDLDHVVIQGVPDSEPVNMGTGDSLFGHQADTINNLGDSGELDKLMIMDMVMGNNERHPLNMLFSKNGSKLHLINHDELGGISLMEPPHTVPAYIHAYANLKGHNWAERQFHAAAANWLMRANVQKLEKVLHSSGVPEAHAKEAIRRLLAAKTYLRDNSAKATCGGVFLSGFQPQEPQAPEMPEDTNEKA